MAKVWVGTSGFSFDSWRGVFYPPDIKREKMLRFYARNFSTVEINATFYRFPARKTFETMIANTPPEFRFVAKVHSEATHGRNVKEACRGFADCIEPLRQSGKLAAVVAQLPERALPIKDELDRINWIADELREDRLLFEFRNAKWATPKLGGLLRRIGVGFCCTDLPQLPHLMPRLHLAIGAVSVTRLHGRNAASWSQPGSGKDRYDYLYTEAELQEWVSWVKCLEKQEEAYVFMNNCYTGKAVINARMFQQLMRMEDELAA